MPRNRWGWQGVAPLIFLEQMSQFNSAAEGFVTEGRIAIAKSNAAPPILETFLRPWFLGTHVNKATVPFRMIHAS